MLTAFVVTYEIAVDRAEQQATRANAELEALLLNILPRKVVAQLKQDPHAIAELHGEVTSSLPISWISRPCRCDFIPSNLSAC